MSSVNPLEEFVQRCINQQINLTAYDLVNIDHTHVPTGLVTHLFNQTQVAHLWIMQTLSEILGIAFLDLDTLDKTKIPFTLFSERLMRQYPIVPLWKNRACLYIGLSDPFQTKAVEAVRFELQTCVRIILVEPKKLETLRKAVLEKLRIASPILLQESTATISDHSSKNDSSEVMQDLPLVHYVNQVLYHAIDKKASDIHFEPKEDGLKIRFRIDGILYLQTMPPQSLAQRILARIKVMARLDIAERRLAQEGRFTFNMPHSPKIIDCRVSTCPTLYGEKIALRLLTNEQQLLDIKQLGFNSTQYNIFLKALNQAQGMILVTGPTGSGKSRTLYSALHHLNKDSVNISSAEDPVEIQLPGVNQVNVHSKIGLDFESVFKTLLRQDPDIIMVGEMRDTKTAHIGIQAAQTGHLVLSTLHTNSASETLIRLSNMDIPIYNIANSVNLIVAQRLARRLCRHCKTACQMSSQELLRYGIVSLQIVTVFKPGSCQYCMHGYQGRIGIFELLPITETISQKILKDTLVYDIQKQAEIEGMMTLKQAYFEKIQAGIISITELERLIQ